MRSDTSARSLFLASALAVASGCSSGTSDDVRAQDAALAGDASVGTGDAAANADAAVAPRDAAPDAAVSDATAAPDAADDADADADAGDGCFISTVGVPGECVSTSACAAFGAYTSTPGYCPGPADIQCCAPTPSVADNPPVPTGWVLMQQTAVTAAMTTWAVQILDDPTGYPMFATTMMTFGTQLVMARVEWHPPDFQNGVIHRGVTLYVPV